MKRHAEITTGTGSATVVSRPRSLRVLQAMGVLGGLAQSLAGAAGALLAREVSGSDGVAGLPQALLVAGSAIAALALSALTRRVGRRLALSAGLAVALAGCMAVVVGGVVTSLLVVLAGSLLVGAGNTVVMLGRYAAADLESQDARGRAMGAVLAATTVGAVTGPNLLAPAGGLATELGLGALTGPYLMAAIGFAMAAAVLIVGLPADQPLGVARRQRWLRQGSVGSPPSGPLTLALSRRHVDARGAAGLAVLTIANLIMVGVMTMAPVHLHHSGSGLAAIGLIISLHIAGMFAPSPLSGWLTDRVGPQRAAAISGVVLVVAAASAAISAGDMARLAAALVLLGVGWNLALLSGSALLTTGVPAADRPRLEGWGELSMGIGAAVGGAAAGPLVAAGGYAQLGIAGALAAALILPIARRRLG